MKKTKFFLCGMVGLLLYALPLYTAVQYLWDFGDGNTSTAEKPFHTYDAWGEYHWSLTVTRDGETCVRYGTICIGEYEWDFGDNSPVSHGKNPFHIYKDAGVYNWALTSYNCKGQECLPSVGTITISAPSPGLTITSPKAGDELFPFTIFDISWTVHYINTTLKITLWKDGVQLGTIADDIYPRSGSYRWTVATYKEDDGDFKTAVRGNGYSIKIEENVPQGFSSTTGAFTISSQAVISVLSPNGGEKWHPGTIRNIAWTASSVSNPVSIILVKNGVEKETIKDNLDPLSGSYPWTVGKYPGLPSEYIIKVKENNTNIYDTGDNPFTISNDPTITVTSPNGGETWALGAERLIMWNANNITEPFKITLWDDILYKGPIGEDIAPTQTSFLWVVGNYGGPPIGEGTEYSIKIEAQGTGIFDASDNFFTISDDPAIRVISPNGNETWSKGFPNYITWASYNVRDSSFDIFLFKDGVNVGTIAQNLPSTMTSYQWSTGTYIEGSVSGTGYYIQVKEVGTSVSDISDSSFKVFENY